MITYPSSAYDKWRTTPPEPKEYSYNVKLVVEIEMVVKSTSDVEALEKVKEQVGEQLDELKLDYELSGTAEEWNDGDD